MRLGWLALLLGLGLVACTSANRTATGPSAQPTAAQTALVAAVSQTPAQIVPPSSSPASAVSSPVKPDPVTPASTAIPAATAASAAAVMLTQPPGDPQGWHFAPAETTVRVGGTVNWTNPSGNEIHTVTANDGRTFDSGVLSGGDSFSFTFLTAGAFPYHCTLHAWMKGVVTVVP
jgi:plastocyanin